MPDLGPLVDAVFTLLGPALRVLVRTTLGMMLLAGLGAVGAFYLAFHLSQGSALGAALGALWALAALAGLGMVLAVKRAVARALVEGLGRLRLGSRAVDAVFGRLLGVSEAAAVGERGGALVRSVERLPLQQAEERLRGAVDTLLAERVARGGLRGWMGGLLQRRLLAMVADVTLRRFRSEGATGVDLGRVRDELGVGIDHTLSAQIEGGLRRLAAMVILGGLGLALGGAALIGRLAHA